MTALRTKGPVTMEIGVTSVCNMTVPCVMCGKHKGRNDRHMKKEHFLKCLAYLRGCEGSVALHGIGEPLCYPGLLDLIEDPGTAKLCFNTNGLLLDRKAAARLVDGRVESINVSIDAASPETYRKIRHHDLEKVKANLKYLRGLKRRRGAGLPRVTVNMCLMKENVREMAAFVELAAEVGAESVLFFPMNPVMRPNIKWGWFDYSRQHVEDEPGLHDACAAVAEERARELGLRFVYNGRKRLCAGEAPAWHGGKLPDKCPTAFGNVLVDTDGGVRLCCHMKGSLGSLEDSTLEEIYNGPLAGEVRRMIDTGGFHELCRNEDCIYFRNHAEAARRRLPARLEEAGRAAGALAAAARAWRAGDREAGAALLPGFTSLLGASDALLGDLGACGGAVPEKTVRALMEVLRGFMASADACVRGARPAAVNREIAQGVAPLLPRLEALLDSCGAAAGAVTAARAGEAVCA